ncbi:hypothetical protein pb186bvf_009832 [Paramecium bursaria]
MGVCTSQSVKQKSSLKLMKVEFDKSEPQQKINVEQINGQVFQMWQDADVAIQKTSQQKCPQLHKLRINTESIVQNSLKRIGRRGNNAREEILKDVVFANILFQQLEKIQVAIQEEIHNNSLEEFQILQEKIIDFGVRFKQREVSDLGQTRISGQGTMLNSLA